MRSPMEKIPFANQKQYHSSNGWHQALFESALDGIVTMDGSGRIVALNPAAEKMFGYQFEQAAGRRVSDLLIPDSFRKSHEKGLLGFLTTGRKAIMDRRVEIKAMRSDQSVFAAELSVISVNSGAPPLFVACIREIPEQKPADLKTSEPHQDQYAVNIKKTLMQTILAVTRIVEIRDPYTAAHQRRVAHLSARMAKALNFSDEQIDGVYLGALIHDIGKIAVPPEILARPGKLLDEDRNYLKIHCRKGHEILEPVNFPWPVAEIALQHHEHMDGTGYPQGLRGEEILLESRIICVADVVESLTAHRPYRPAFALTEALEAVNRKAGRWYDKNAVAACNDLFEAGYSIDAIDMDELTGMAALS